MYLILIVGLSVSSYSAEYNLPPPTSLALPPLPPVPLPPVRQAHRHASRIATSKRPRPIVKPPILTTSYLAREQTLDDCIEAFNAHHSEGSSRGRACCRASLHHDNSAMLVMLGREGEDGAAWILLRSLRRDGSLENGRDARVIEVESIKVLPHDKIAHVRHTIGCCLYFSPDH